MPDEPLQPAALHEPYGLGARAAAMIRIKRVYEPRARGDGRRILVERLWPRGVAKDFLHAHAWMKDVAPSTELRKWFAHRVSRWPEFKSRYVEELKAKPDLWASMLDDSRRGTVTLLYSAHDVEHNSAVVLRDFLERRLSRRARPPNHASVRRLRGLGAERTRP